MYTWKGTPVNVNRDAHEYTHTKGTAVNPITGIMIDNDIMVRSVALTALYHNEPVFPDDGIHPGMVKRYILTQGLDDGSLETLGYIQPALAEDLSFWYGLDADIGVREALESEDQPHSGLTCEVTGAMFEEPWYFADFAVDPIAQDNEFPFVQGAESAMNYLMGTAEQYMIEGWSIDNVGIVARIRIGDDVEGENFEFTARMERDGEDLAIVFDVTKLDDDGERARSHVTNHYWEPLNEVDDEDTESENSPRYLPLDALKDFFYLDDSFGMKMGFECLDVEGGIVLRNGEHARRFGKVEMFK